MRTASYFELKTDVFKYHFYIAVFPLVSIQISTRGGMGKNTPESGLSLSQRCYEGVKFKSVPRET
jgi:hypothetical protein